MRNLMVQGWSQSPTLANKKVVFLQEVGGVPKRPANTCKHCEVFI